MELTEAQQKGLARLREPFPDHQISKLPKQLKRNDQDRFACRQGTQASADGHYCGGFHARSIHLDYVGHAALTDRLLEVDPEWTWEPLAIGPDGLPVFDNNGGLWIRITICGLTRLGYGDAQGKVGGNAVKEAIGDALRNAGMRFGAALDLWHKGELHDASEEQGKSEAPAEEPAPVRTITRAPAISEDVRAAWQAKIDECTTKAELKALWEMAKDDGAQDEILALIVAAGKAAA